MPIKMLVARQVFDSTSLPTVEVDLVTELGLFRIGVPSTDVKKPAEAVQMRDNIPEEYHGMGVTKAVNNVNNIIAPELIKMGYEVTMQKEIDDLMITLDGTENKSRLGANAILAVSLVVAKAGAAKKGLPLYRHISDLAGVVSIILPVPHFTILSGGVLSSNMLPFQEYMILPTGAATFYDAMRIGTDIYNYVKKYVREKYGIEASYVCDNGGFSIPFGSHTEALAFLTEAIKEMGFVGKAEIGINCVAVDMLKDGAYDLEFKTGLSNPQDYVAADNLIESFLDNSKDFPLCSVEDPFDPDDWASWSAFVNRAGPIQVVGNDLTQTNIRRVGLAIEKKAATAVALRLNQSGTLSELIECYKLLKAAKVAVLIEDRWGDTDDLFLADLVVGLSAGQIKCGGPAHSERVGKYNQVLRIEQELGALSKYAGKNYRISQ